MSTSARRKNSSNASVTFSIGRTGAELELYPARLMPQPTISLVVLSWNKLELTRRCVESLRRNTDVPYELIVVDNDSSDGSAAFAREAADIGVNNDQNLGFAAGMNSGLARASGDYVAFVNNDTTFPPNWASSLLEVFQDQPQAGIVLPAVTRAGNPVTVRSAPGSGWTKLVPFAEFPSGVVEVLSRKLMKGLGGWNEAYERASAEDLDLAFTVWAHGYEIFLDERVLVEHESQASVRQIANRAQLYRKNLSQFLESWENPANHDRLVASIESEDFERNLMRAQTAIIWIRRLLIARDDAAGLRKTLSEGTPSRHRWLRSKS